MKFPYLKFNLLKPSKVFDNFNFEIVGKMNKNGSRKEMIDAFINDKGAKKGSF